MPVSRDGDKVNAAELEATWKITIERSDGCEQTFIWKGHEIYQIAKTTSEEHGVHLPANACIEWVHCLLAFNAIRSTRQRAYRARVAPDGGTVFSDPVSAW